MNLLYSLFFLLFVLDYSISYADKSVEMLENDLRRNPGEAVKGVIPTGWSVVKSSRGDLNNDEILDAVMLLRKENEPVASKYVLAFFLLKGRWMLSGFSDSAAIDLEDSGMNLAFSEIKIKDSVVKIDFGAGSRESFSASLKIRYQKEKFVVIGFTNYLYDRVTGSSSEEFDINYSSGKCKHTRFAKRRKVISYKRYETFKITPIEQYITELRTCLCRVSNDDCIVDSHSE
jgi:hypothetical protein